MTFLISREAALIIDRRTRYADDISGDIAGNTKISLFARRTAKSLRLP